MYALICRTPDEAHCLVVSEHKTPLESILKAEAKSFLDQRMTEDEQEEFGYTATIANATTRWTDEDEEYPYEIFIEETDWI